MNNPSYDGTKLTHFTFHNYNNISKDDFFFNCETETIYGNTTNICSLKIKGLDVILSENLIDYIALQSEFSIQKRKILVRFLHLSMLSPENKRKPLLARKADGLFNFTHNKNVSIWFSL